MNDSERLSERLSEFLKKNMFYNITQLSQKREVKEEVSLSEAKKGS